MRRDQLYIEKALGKEYARVLWDIGEKSKYHAKSLMDEYQIQCDYKKVSHTPITSKNFVKILGAMSNI